MSAPFLLVALLVSATPSDKLPKPLPALVKEPVIDGDAKELGAALELTMPDAAKGPSAKVTARAATRKDALVVAVTIEDDVLRPDDSLDVTLFFPDSGTTARGVVYRFSSTGLQPPPEEIGAPAFAQALVKSATQTSARGFTLEALIPARAFPRFQASKPLMLSLCLDYADVDAADGPVTKLTSCPFGEMAPGPARLADEVRKSLKLTPTSEVEGLEAREHGWVGFSKLHSAAWAMGDEALTETSLRELVAPDAVSPASVAMPEAKLRLPDNRQVLSLLTGKNPYLKDRCIPDHELRMTLYVVTDRTAVRALEWPAANCKLGKAMRIELDESGSLELGYTGGATHHFTWVTDHFERSELGLAFP